MPTLTTAWGDALLADPDAIPWPDHPRPMLRRERWRTLNGWWEGRVTGGDPGAPEAWSGRIRVPFPIESRLSGVQRPLGPDETLHCRRSFTLDAPPDGRLRLHFDAVDHDCSVWLNDQPLGGHRGGNLPFCFDATAAAVAGENRLRVEMRDATGGFQLKGKQTLQPGRIHYSRVSGIWQSVWLEWVPDTFIERLSVRAACSGAVTVEPKLGGTPAAPGSLRLRVTALLGGAEVASAGATVPGGEVALQIPSPRLWTPDTPTLYALRVELLDADGAAVDRVASHTGLRELGTAPDASGRPRLTLNGQPLLHFGPLDQGWWPDGLLCPPSVEALVSDVEFAKAAGFNTIRKHVKVEPQAFYAACDRLGILVWQDQPSGGPSPAWIPHRQGPDAAVPEPGGDAAWPEPEHAFWMEQWAGLVDHLDAHPCVAVWVPFNEAWGQHASERVGAWTAARDPSRALNIASGGNFFPVGDVADAHRYPEPYFDFDDPRMAGFVAVVGEFGGHGLPIDGHLWSLGPRNWGYGDLPADREELVSRYRASIEELAALRSRGLSAGIYTQTSDVEEEINGLLTYDRRVQKIPAETLREIHAALSGS
ncbi:glycoside hydrolase family 2 protein [Phycisphaera mikurensis]|uniref:Putative glycoside hydrolase n=1 Tax=Phycisphaera mikurensis (strain NBRC 102666 / KCTC 22515 / FYK2301M01) TaxID=1142394 RepID=I0IJ81_PHYMF|nr:glycoside hydrolase family 2 [Phycisphaera mikurensis]MBB6443291.1 beta-galactosidase [Phycisphaera mikurensis]BAM05319.1 putative glycoside hydrolase [Phycisphaera mikurensis NBRC 102666]